MYTIEKITHDIDASTAAVLNAIDGVSDKHLNERPAETTWSAAENIRHLIALDKFINSILQGETIPTERDPAEKIPEIQRIFSDQQRKLTAPETLQPQQGNETADELAKEFSALREEMKTILSTGDITATCTGFKHRFFGEMTRLEWVFFSICHAARHAEQVRNAVRKVSGIIDQGAN